MISKRNFLSGVTTVGLMQALGHPSAAQTFPARLIKIVVPFPAGGPADVVARLLADKLSAAFTQSVIVENRPGGAGGSIGANAVASAEPDGYTLLLCPVDVLTQVPLVYRNIDYNPLKSFAPIVLLLTSPFVIVVNPAVPVHTIQELATYAKTNPGKVSFASPGHGTYPHLLGELFKRSTGAEIIHVPYRGVGPAITDLLAGQVQMYFETSVALLPQVQAGKLRALAVAGDEHSSYFPGLPTTAEGGFPSLVATFTLGLFAPAGTPESIIDKLNAATNDALKSAELQERLKNFATLAKGGSVQDFAAFVAANAKTSIEMVGAAGIRRE